MRAWRTLKGLCLDFGLGKPTAQQRVVGAGLVPAQEGLIASLRIQDFQFHIPSLHDRFLVQLRLSNQE